MRKLILLCAIGALASCSTGKKTVVRRTEVKHGAIIDSTVYPEERVVRTDKDGRRWVKYKGGKAYISNDGHWLIENPACRRTVVSGGYQFYNYRGHKKRYYARYGQKQPIPGTYGQECSPCRIPPIKGSQIAYLKPLHFTRYVAN